MNRAALFKLTLIWACAAVLWDFIGNPALAVAILGTLWYRREATALFVNGLEHDSGAGGACLALVLFIGYALISPPGAADDLLRDIASGAYGFDYRKMYPGTTLPNYDMYLGFDYALSALNSYIGPRATLHAVQAIAVASFLSLFVFLCRQSSVKLRAEHYALLAVAFATPLSGRLFLGRPEIFLTAWGLAAALATTPRRIALWVAGGLLCSTGYWLAALYFPFALLLRAGWKQKGAVLVLLFGFHLGYWHLISNGDYLSSLRLLSVWTANRLTTIQETQSFLQLLLNPYFAALSLLAAVSCAARKLTGRDYAVFALIAFFALSGMVRYVAVWVGLLLMLILPWLANQSVRPLALRAGLLVTPLFCAATAFSQAASYGSLPAFQLPAGAYVLTSMDTATFAVPYFNAGRVQVAPSMELGANTHEVQALAAQLTHGKLSCDQLRAQGFTHVVENHLTQIPACLRLIAIRRGWRAWQVVQ
ncbi:hypothetical protein F6X40_17105 [Paraburkholderia sp. UCT31]|uniref:hypothetical protein n=1 Tax=Paraburkholderia sp. UCT31 TaxID=2615209 RepID=UPI0016563E74|nr:hypothetical protein [Paraburkholderia sp. UCT31]MBC8738494.1 hypothetical protein [Paraburkholderia sp. UCT31]